MHSLCATLSALVFLKQLILSGRYIISAYIECAWLQVSKNSTTNPLIEKINDAIQHKNEKETEAITFC